MFGESIESQFTLNLPHQFVASKIAVWTTVCLKSPVCILPSVKWYTVYIWYCYDWDCCRL